LRRDGPPPWADVGEAIAAELHHSGLDPLRFRCVATVAAADYGEAAGRTMDATGDAVVQAASAACEWAAYDALASARGGRA